MYSINYQVSCLYRYRSLYTRPLALRPLTVSLSLLASRAAPCPTLPYYLYITVRVYGFILTIPLTGYRVLCGAYRYREI